MENSKLIQVLKTLDKQELKAFDKYLSKLYSDHAVAIDLFHYLKPFYPEFKHKKLDLEYITFKTFKLDKTKRISNEASKLLTWLEEFLLLEKVKRQSNSYEVKKILIDLYKERKLDHFYFREIDKAEEELLQHRKDIWLPLHLMELYHARYYHPFTEKLEPNQVNLEKSSLELDAFYKLNQLKFQCELQSRNAILQIVDFDKNKSNHFEAPQKAGVLYEILYNLYSKAYKFITSKNDDICDEVLTDLMKYGDQISPEDHLILLVYLINYKAKKIRNIERNTIQEVFTLYKYGMEKQLLKVGGYITASKFQNIINVACELGEVAWAEAFYQEHKGALCEEGREHTLSLAKAHLLFAHKDYNNALKLLRTVQLKNDALNLNARISELKCFYELRHENEEQLEYGIKAFYINLKRNKTLNMSLLHSAQHFLTMLKLMISGNHVSEELLEKLKTLTPIFGGYWLLTKIKELSSPGRQLRV